MLYVAMYFMSVKSDKHVKNMIDNMAFCLTPIFTKWYFLSNTQFCEEKTLGCGLDSSFQLFKIDYIIYKTYKVHIQDQAYLDVF